MEQPDNWRRAGEVPGGKGHLLTSVVSVMGDDSTYVRAHTACSRLTHVRQVPWSDLLWEDPSWACRFCQKYVQDLLESELRRIRQAAVRLDPAEQEDRAERLRLYTTLQAIARQAAQPGPVLPSRARLAADLTEARRQASAALDLLAERDQTIRRLGGRTSRDGKELDRVNELLSDLRLENRQLQAANQQLARLAARAEVLRDVVMSLFPDKG